MNDTSQCGLCGKLGQFKKQWHGVSLHGACWNAVRSYRRTLSSNKNALAESDKRSVLDRAGWRADALPLVIKDDGSLEKRRKIMLRYKVQKFQVEEKIVDKILLTRRRFAGYHQFWDGWDGDHSSRMFDRMHKQDPQYNTDEESIVAERDNVKTRTRDGEKRARKRSRSPSKRDRGRSGSGGGPPVAVTSRSRASSNEESNDASGADSGGDDELASLESTLPRGPPSKKGGEKPLTAQTLAAHNVETVRSRRAASVSGASVKSSRDAKASNSKSTPLKFIQEKSELLRAVKEALAAYDSKKSPKSRIIVARKTLTKEQIANMEITPDMVLTELEQKAVAVRNMMAKFEGLRPSDFKDLVFESIKVIGELETKLAVAEEYLEVMEYMNGETKRKIKLGNMAARHQRSKLVDRLVLGGCGKVFAKCFLEKRFGNADGVLAKSSVLMCPDTFSFEAIAMWETGDDETLALLTQIAKIQGFSECTVEARLGALQTALAGNPMWKGAMTKVGNVPCEDALAGLDVPGTVKLQSHAGAAPWLFGLQRGAWRWGAHAVPLPGVGAFFQAKVHDLTLSMFSVAELIKTGVTLPDVRAYLETPAGSEWYARTHVMLTLKPGDVAWIPYGVGAIPMLLPDASALADESFGYAWHMPVYVLELAKKVDDRAWAAITMFNEEQMRKNATSGLWKDRHSAFKEFCDALG